MPPSPLKILTLDVERIDGVTQQHFWDRGDLQKRYIHYETVVREPRTTIVCAKWYGEPELIKLAEWDKGGRRTFLRRVYRLLEEADVLVGHNVDNADVPWLKGDLNLRAGFPVLPPFKTVDTLKVARRELGSGAPFKSLNVLCQILGLPAKTDVYDREAMERAVVEKSVEDRERLVEYCAGDVIATEALYEWARPFMRNHPALFADDKGTEVCTRCGSDDIQWRGVYRAATYSYPRFRCQQCGGWGRGSRSFYSSKLRSA